MGDKVGTQVKAGGPFERAISTMPDEAVFPWLAAAAQGDNGKDKGPRRSRGARPGKRSKYTCAQCGLNAWARAGAKLICGECHRELVETKGKGGDDDA